MIGLLLAAGFSRRFGDADKLLQPLPNGQIVVFASAQKLIQVLPNSIAVIRQGNDRLAKILTALGYCLIECDAHDLEMADSLSKAMRYLLQYGESDEVLIALADMPFIQVETIQTIARTLQQQGGIVVPTYLGQRGHPVGFSASFCEELTTLRGDQGARTVIQQHPQAVHFIATEDAGILRDIDTPSDLM